MRLSRRQYEVLKANTKRSGPKFKQDLSHESLEERVSEEENSTRAIVRITSFRTQLCDPDNICPKYQIDALRYQGVIRNDRLCDIKLEVTQVKVKTKAEERTEIEVIR